MADVTKQTYDFLDEAGVSMLAKGILAKANERIVQRITQDMEYGDTTHVPSSDAVLKAIAKSRHTTIQTVTGDINEQVPLAQRSTSVLYFQRDSVDDTTWMIYIWNADPELQPDPNGYWICLGDTEIDLSGYWSKDADDVAELKEVLGINGLAVRVTEIEGALPEKVDREDMHALTPEEVQAILDDAYISTDIFINAATIRDAFAEMVAEGRTETAFTIANNIDFTTEGPVTIPAGVTATITVPSGVTLGCGTGNVFSVSTGSKLVLKGSGTIVKTGKTSSGAITVENGGALEIDGVEIDATTQGKENNFAYGVYAKNSSVITFKSGKIKTAYGSAISTNNTTGGSTINVEGGELLSDGSYAIYNASQGEINITGGKVQGINARMGTINISGDAQIIPTTIDASTCDDVGAEINTSGCIWFGDTIALVSGTYTDPNGIDINLNIEGNATVGSEFRSAIGVYMIDTKENVANVNVTVADGSKVTTSEVGTDPIKVYDHAYISAAATAAGKSYAPKSTSVVKVKVSGSQVYPS